MGSSGVLPDAGPSSRTELLQDGGRCRVVRLFQGQHTVIRKEPLGPDAPRRLRHEREMLERLRDVPGIVQLLDSPRHSNSIVLADVGGPSLADRANPLEVSALIALAVDLARAVAEMHRRGVMHRDITPANILVARDGAPVLVDFALATTFAEIRPEFVPVARGSEIAGTLAYLAPEQTGRTGRPVDQRSDLYALGATLYELATGAPPFASDDPLQLTHDHLARVPVPPARVNSQVPEPLSDIILRLLAKEPDNRYQTADGLAHDLEQVRDARAGSAPGPLTIGEHDVPRWLLPPSRLVGRDDETAALQAAFEEALAGRCRAVLVSGSAGVGKTALVDDLRPVVTRSGGWFVAGKFDQYRRDVAASGVHQAFRALGRLLLAQPEDELVAARERILTELGPNAGLMAAVVPEFAALLGVPPDPGDPLTAQVRGQRNGVQILRAIASRERPVVMFFDDVQWAGPTPLGFLDMLLDEQPVEGLLLVSARRDEAVDGADPESARPSGWRDRAGVQHLRLYDLPLPSLVAMVADMLHVPPATAADLARQLHLHTTGNPYESVELLGALRRDGLLTATAAGWQWDSAAVRAHLGRSETGELLAARVAATPPATRHLMEAMAGLSGRVEMSVLAAATGQPADVLEQTLKPALVEGVLVAEPGLHAAVRFRHDRIREAIRRGVTPARQQALHLAMARRLAAEPDLFAIAAEQYLPVTSTPEALDDPAERRQVVDLLRRAADQARSAGDHQMMSNLLRGASQLIDPREISALVEVHMGLQVALFSLGRLEEADEEYRTITTLRAAALQAADATAIQVRSLTHRNRFAEAIELGLESLGDYGISVPPVDQLPAELDQGFDRLHRWLDHTDAADDLARPELSDPNLLAATRLIDAVLPTAYFASDPDLIAWLGLEALQIWIEHGPGPTLVGPAGHAAYHAGPQRGDYAAGYRALRRVVALGEARGFEPGTSQARHMFAALVGWFEPIENGVREAQRAREELVVRGDLAYAGYTYQLSVPYLVDCAPSLESFVAEVIAGLTFLRRTGDEQTAEWLDSYRWLDGVLRGDGTAAARDPLPSFQYADNPLPLLYAHLCHAIGAVVFGDQVGLEQHSAAAMSLLPAAVGFFSTSTVRLLRGLALAEQARDARGAARAALLAELDELTGWLAARAVHVPDNFLHLQRLLEAERAWAIGDFRVAAQAFDSARREVARRQRPWHRALITESAARFYLAHGLDQAGRELLAEARHHYGAWGAAAKVAQLDWAYPALPPEAHATSDAQHRTGTQPPAAVTTGTIDLFGILSASHALSSETSIDRLHARVVEVLSAMTGATGVHLLLLDDDRRDRLVPGPDHSTGTIAPGGRVSEADAPMSVLRYVQRTGETLIVDDATRDDRFARDAYFADLDSCSVLAMPVISRGALRAVLLLQNRLIRAAFTAQRLDAVRLIAAQLAVSLDNAQLYADLTASRARIVAAADQARRRIERDLHDGAQQRLVTLAMHARMCKASAPAGSGALEEELDALVTEATTAMTELRELARGIHPPTLAEGGLRSALNSLARRSVVPVTVQVPAGRRLPEPIEIAAYYVVTEALTNATKHAAASVVTVAVETRTGPAGAVVHVRVHDDGRGGARLTGGSGLLGLKDRVEALGGRLSVRSAPDIGTTVAAELPLP